MVAELKNLSLELEVHKRRSNIDPGVAKAEDADFAPQTNNDGVQGFLSAPSSASAALRQMLERRL